MKLSTLIPLLFAATLLAACEEKPYKAPVPHTEPDKATGIEQAIQKAAKEQERPGK